LGRTSAQIDAARSCGETRGRLAGNPIDRAYLARFTLGNAALEREVLELFAEQAPLYLERLREANTGKAWKDAAHTIKGSASAVGSWRLARFAEMAEQVDVEADMAHSEGHRDEAIAAVAMATEEACRFIGRLFTGA
jgi:HPt (histidine-containing phosphotransfer) domain-containing protein